MPISFVSLFVWFVVVIVIVVFWITLNRLDVREWENILWCDDDLIANKTLNRENALICIWDLCWIHRYIIQHQTNFENIHLYFLAFRKLLSNETGLGVETHQPISTPFLWRKNSSELNYENKNFFKYPQWKLQLLMRFGFFLLKERNCSALQKRPI